MNYRKLTDSEINQLENNGCTSGNWGLVKVTEKFEPKRLHRVTFEGEVELGLFYGKVKVEEGIEKPSGIYNTYLKDCSVGDRVYLSNVGSLAGYDISNDVAVENVGSLLVNKETTFGNGIELEVLNEGGGREIPVFDRLSAQIAYLMVNYRHDRHLTQNLHQIIKDYSNKKKSRRGKLEEGTRILDTTTIKNVYFGSFATVRGAHLLQEGSVMSCREDPVNIGHGVIAKSFIALSGSKIDGGAIVENSFIGQAVKLDKQFSTENSVFFANSEGFHGEAVSVFGGPYTVSHHKSTLLIAGQYSFYNAGSGTNESNHLYKFGPIHQGTMERGSKTGSFSYLLWPCYIGPFSVVLGKHKSNFDISQFPYSYIDAKRGRSELIPAINLFTIGTRRDAEKWPNRDRRKDPNKLDLIHFHPLNPFVVQKMIRGSDILRDLKEKASGKQEYVPYKGAHIPRLMIKSALKYYETGINVYLGGALAGRLERSKAETFEELKQELFPYSEAGEGQWVDISGMLSPKSEVDNLCEDIKYGKIFSIEDLENAFFRIYREYEDFAWSWCTNVIGQRLGVDFRNITKEQIADLVREWKDNAKTMNNNIMKDGKKEFSANSKIGFGIDGDEEVVEKDFEAVRGTYEDNSYIQKLKEETGQIERKADDLIDKLNSL
jgi:hypothetical protein